MLCGHHGELSFEQPPREGRHYAVHMLVQLVADLLPQRIEQELHTLPPRKPCRWHEITVTRHENQCIDLMLKGHAGDIQADSHIHPFLTKPEVHVTLTDFSPGRNE